MPRLSTIRLEPLRELVAELRYTPRAALLRCIERAESLALEIDPDITYPMEWIVYRVTGYRPKDSPDGLIVGEALVADLSSLVEHLCDVAGLREDEIEPGASSIDELAGRWSVSRKSIERYRRQGLVARRAESAAGVVRLSFSARVVDGFEEKRSDRLERAASFERIGERERKWLHARALRYHRSLGCAFAPIAVRLSERTGRSLSTVRRAILLADERSPEPTFRVRRKLPEREARVIARAMDWGIKPGLIADRFGRSRTSVLRIATDEHGARLQRHLPSIRPEGAPDGGSIEQAANLILPPASDIRLPCEEPVLEAKTLIASLQSPGSIDAAREARIAGAHWLLLARAAHAIESIPRSTAPVSIIDAAETDLRWALQLRRMLVESQIPLVIRTLEDRLGSPLMNMRPDQIRELVRICMLATIGAVAGFHPLRPGRSLTDFGRLASPVSLAMNRILSEHDLDRVRPASSVGRAATARAELADWTRQLAPWQKDVEAHPRLRGVLDRLDAEDRAILIARYGLAGSPPKTSAAICEELDLTPARIVSAYRRARMTIRQSMA